MQMSLAVPGEPWQRCPALPGTWALPALLPAGRDPHKDAHALSGASLALPCCSSWGDGSSLAQDGRQRRANQPTNLGIVPAI